MPAPDSEPPDNGSPDAFDVAIQLGGRAASPETALESDPPVGPGGSGGGVPRPDRRRWVGFGMVAMAVVLGLFSWYSASNTTQYMHTPGQGHVHASAVLPMPGSTEKALWLGVHDGLFLKLLAPGGPAGWPRRVA